MKQLREDMYEQGIFFPKKDYKMSFFGDWLSEMNYAHALHFKTISENIQKLKSIEISDKTQFYGDGGKNWHKPFIRLIFETRKDIIISMQDFDSVKELAKEIKEYHFRKTVIVPKMERMFEDSEVDN